MILFSSIYFDDDFSLIEENFFRCKEIFEGARELIIVTELLEGGELFQKIVDHDNEDLLEKDCCLYMRQVCQVSANFKDKV